MIDELTFLQLGTLFQGFKFGVLQAYSQIHRIISDSKFSVEDLLDFIEAQKAIQGTASEMFSKTVNNELIKKNCPECGRPMGLGTVNSGPRDQVGGKWKSVWTCTNEKGCGHQIYLTKSPIEIQFKQLSKKSVYQHYLDKQKALKGMRKDE